MIRACIHLESADKAIEKKTILNAKGPRREKPAAIFGLKNYNKMTAVQECNSKAKKCLRMRWKNIEDWTA